MKNKKIITFLLCAIMMFSFTLTAFAEKVEDEQNVDGVLITMELDKSEYQSGDTVNLKVSIKNNNKYPVSDVYIKYPSLPTDIDWDESTMKERYPRILADGYETFTVTGVVRDDAPVAEGFEATSATTDTATEKKDGVSLTTVLVIVGAVVLVVVLIIIIVMVVKKKNAAMSIFLAVTLATSAMAGLSPAVEVDAEVSEDTMVKSNDFKRVSVHDPSIVKDPETGMYYIFGSHLAWAKSEDLIGWTEFKTNINTDYNSLFGDLWENYCKHSKNPNLSGNMWAPDVIYNETMGKWCMYMSINGENWQSAIVLLTADNIEGPYTYVDEVVFSGFHDNNTLNTARANYSDVYKVLGEGADLSRYNSTDIAKINAIDPCVTIDDNGEIWMTYGSWSAGIFQLKIDNNTGLRDYNYTYETKTHVSDAYLGYKIAGGCYNSGEGAYIVKAGDYYYLFVSLGGLTTSGGYNMRVYRSESINGPFVDQNGKSSIFKGWNAQIGYQDEKTVSKYNTTIGVKIFGSYRMYGITTVQVAQGHNSAFVDDNGQIYLIYHTRFAGTSEGHQVRVHQLFINEEDWLVAAPYEYGNETLSTTGYSDEDIIGTYDFVMHSPNSVYVNVNGKEAGIVGGTSESTFVMLNNEFTINGIENKIKMRIDFSKTSGKMISLNANGNISGDYTGKWSCEDGVNVTLTIDGVEYKGVFLKQQNELSTKDVTMTFTVLGKNVTAWGVKDLSAE